MPPIAGYFLILIGALCIAGGVALLRQRPKEAARTVVEQPVPPMLDKVEHPPEQG